MTLAELTASLRPGVDGVLLRLDGRQATFLPAVWEKVPDPADFVRQLQLKAGVPPGYWPEGAQAFLYVAREFGEPIRGQQPPAP